MKDFSTIRDAKDFLANRIAAEAKREDVPLSEIERKMLYFSETDWTLPDMAHVNAESDRDCDENEYEQKIASLIRNLSARFNSKEESDAWDAAAARLGEGDHYLQILIDLSNKNLPGSPGALGLLPALDRPKTPPPHDTLKLWLTAFAIIFGVMGIMATGGWLVRARLPMVADWVFDRNHRWHLALIFVGVWLLWTVRNNLKLIVIGLLSGRDSN